MTIDDVMQNMRLLSLNEVRARLELLRLKDPAGYRAVATLFTPKKTK